jgi:hypothetical protein
LIILEDFCLNTSAIPELLNPVKIQEGSKEQQYFGWPYISRKIAQDIPICDINYV